MALVDSFPLSAVMPRYFFQISDNEASTEDEVGLVFEDDTAARREAMITLGTMLAEAARQHTEGAYISVKVVRTDGAICGVLTGVIVLHPLPTSQLQRAAKRATP